MEAPIKPVEPVSRLEDEDLVTLAVATAVYNLKKTFKKDIVISSSVSSWRGHNGTVNIKIPAVEKEWAEYRKAEAEYTQLKLEYDAEQHGTDVDTYLKAKEKLEDYNRKKCDKAPDKTIDDFIAAIEVFPNEAPDDVIVAS